MLTVYKASAGSGKTFRLTIEYIKHLIIHPRSYENILAVTFTNKATEEMKMRILSQLYGIAHHLPDSKSYVEVMLPELVEINNKQESHFTDKTIDEDFIASQASKALNLLLHHYNFFRVETIDRFFQTVLRNLARELDLTPSLRVEIADDQVVSQAVDRWIEGLTEHDQELRWILEYVSSTMDDEKSWNIIQNIKKFAGVLLTDDYKEVSQIINAHLQSANQTFYAKYLKTLQGVTEDAIKKANQLGKEMLDIMTSHGLDENSCAQGSKGIASFIKKLSTDNVMNLPKPGKNVLKAADPDDTNADNWVKKGASAAVREVCTTQLRPLLVNALAMIPHLQSRIKSVNVTRSNLSRLRMLFAIQKEIEAYNHANDSFLLSDTQELLCRMIGDSDSPFIFEKIGARLHNIMIDEFQDTSRIQWQNFKVLLSDCMSHGYQNLIVGDVKQSIYRWRSGDWRLLNNIEAEFPGQTDPKSLQVNRRSSTRVIDFNNAFFEHAIKNIYKDVSQTCSPEDAQMLKSAYDDVKQEYPEGSTCSGYVEMRMLPADDNKNATLKYITDTIEELISNGLQQKDIAILVRTKNHIPDIAQYCISVFSQHENTALHNIKLVSDEAYLLSSSPALSIIVDALRYLVNPDDSIVHARLSLCYQRYVLGDDRPQSELLNSMILPERWDTSLVTHPLYQLCEEIFDIFDIAKLSGQSSYVCCFFDGLSDFLQRFVGDIKSFLDYWDEKLSTKKIESDTDEGIRILSIHKSKGLEYQTVIVPFCDWTLELGSLLWCKPDADPFKQLPVIPLDYLSLHDTIYESDFREEHLQNEVDNINLMYVALTRAKDNLFISSCAGQDEKKRGKLLETIMPAIAESLEGSELDNGTLTFGEIVYPKRKEKNISSNVFLQPFESKVITPQTSDISPEFRESNASKEFTLTDEDESEQQRTQFIKLGNVLHSLFANMRTLDDLDASILRLEMDGLLFGQDITADALRSRIDRCFQNEQVASWFSPHWRLYNECTILTYDIETSTYSVHRPDRVMTDGKETIVVDFKLYSLKDEYFDQVRRYMNYLRQMGYPNVHGYLWQVFSNKITEVK